MAISVAWQTVTSVTASTSLYTVPATTAATSFYPYARDLVLCNSGTVTIFLSLGTGSTGASTTASFQVPTGGTVILTQCQVPQGGIVYGTAPTGVGQLSVGYATNVAYI